MSMYFLLSYNKKRNLPAPVWFLLNLFDIPRLIFFPVDNIGWKENNGDILYCFVLSMNPVHAVLLPFAKSHSGQLFFKEILESV